MDPPNPKSWRCHLRAPLLRIASIECLFGFSVCVVVDVVTISQIDCIRCVWCGLCDGPEKERKREREQRAEQSKGDPNIRVWGAVIPNRTDFSVAFAVVCLLVCLFFCFVLWIRQNTTNPRSGHYNKLDGLCDTHTHTHTT